LGGFASCIEIFELIPGNAELQLGKSDYKMPLWSSIIPERFSSVQARVITSRCK